MKNLALLLLLLIAPLSYSQPQKDSLIHRDREIILEKLEFVEYLRKEAMKFFTTARFEAEIKNKTFSSYFTDSIVANNPLPQYNIREYLNLKTGKAIIPKQFYEAVFIQNSHMVYDMIETYGYPTIKRLNTDIAVLKSFNNHIIYGDKKYRKKFRKLLKKEYKAGNLTKSHYLIMKSILSPNQRRYTTEKDLKRLSKRTGSKIIINGKEL